MPTTTAPATGSDAGTPDRTPKGLLDRVLGVFTDVRGGEGITAILLMLNIFFLLAAYSMLKTIREPLVLTVPGGAEVKSYAAAAIAGLFIILVPLYSALASRVSRVKLINSVTLFFVVTAPSNVPWPIQTASPGSAALMAVCTVRAAVGHVS